jgi:23S rRNA (guanosine2251-2'-O)-methyltransferase
MRDNTRSKPLRLIVGRNPVVEALTGGTAIEKIFLLRSASGEDISKIKRLAAQLNIPLAQVPQEKLDRFTKAQHQGVVALAGLLQYVELQDGISHIVESGATPLLVMLDGVTDVRNIGAIARTAWCCGVQGLILPTSHAATLGEEAIKTSAGALNKIMLLRTPSAQQAMDVLRLNGIQVLGTELRASIPVHEADFSAPTCIVMGAEDKGISKEVIKRADKLIHIPMATKFDSLNVSVATGMVLYEAMRQRGNAA